MTEISKINSIVANIVPKYVTNNAKYTDKSHSDKFGNKFTTRKYSDGTTAEFTLNKNGQYNVYIKKGDKKIQLSTGSDTKNDTLNIYKWEKNSGGSVAEAKKVTDDFTQVFNFLG